MMIVAVYRRQFTIALIVAMFFLAACSSTSAVSHSQPIPKPTDPFPAFSFWRAAYMSQDNCVHAVSLDGKSDVIGSCLPLKGGIHLSNTLISPDGHDYAYSQGSLIVYDLMGQAMTIGGDHITTASALNWSPDGKYLAVGEGYRHIWVIDMATYTSHVIPYAPPQNQTPFVIGWIDMRHIVISRGTETTLVYSSIDITSGQERVITTIPNSEINGELFAPTLSPDGSNLMVVNSPFRDNPFTPTVFLINTQTGQKTSLPNITQQTKANFSTIAWRPGNSHTVAIASDYISNGGNQTWLLNVQTDSATRLLPNQYPAQWSPDGKTLIISTGWPGASFDTAPYTITAITLTDDNQVASQITLTTKAYVVPFLGFLHHP
jgi:Tol biopolymer transport system component